MAVLCVAVVVFIALSIANYIGWLRTHPEIQAAAWFNGPDYGAHVASLFQRAIGRVHGGASAYLPIYDVQNPGFFILVAELFVRAGATTPFPLEVLSIFLYNVGAVCFLFWVYILFDDLVVAASATVFLTLSQFFLSFSGVVHTFPYEFVFFNATLLLYACFLRNNRPAYLVGSLVFMFFTCMNYWMYYISSWIIMMGLWWQFRGRPSFTSIAMISAPPVAAAILTTFMVMFLSGGLWTGGERLLQIFVARTIDARLPGGSWFPDQRFMSLADIPSYPSLVKYRLQWAFDFDLHSFAIAGVCAGVLLYLRRASSLTTALILLAGGLSWYYVMFQHTFIHHFVGQYSFMAICPIFGLIVAEGVACARRERNLWKTGFNSEFRMRSLEVLRIVTIIAVVTTSCFFIGRTYGFVKETIIRSNEVETEFRQAVEDICREHSEVTLKDLQMAAKGWSFEWHPEILVDTNQMPKCR